MTPADNGKVAVEPAREVAPSRRTRPAWWWIAGAAVCAVALAGGGVAANTAFTVPEHANQQQVPISTAKIELGTLTGNKTVMGVLDFAAGRDLQAGAGGTVTHLPDAGSQIGQGGELYRINNVPAFLFHGQLPAWRAFEQGMDDGPDVQQLEAALQALGFFDGEPDQWFRWGTVEAIYAWQEATGQEQTGRIDLGRIMFSPTDLRVGEIKVSVGNTISPGTVLYRVSGLDKQIQADVKLADQKLAAPGVIVHVRLPDGSTTPGTITAVGQVIERDTNGNKTQAIPIVVVLDDPTAADGLQRANVTLDIPSESREDVLSVPVDALIALPRGGFGIEIVHADGTTEQVPVEVGLYTGGRVEVSGEGIKPDLDVVVPKR